MDWPFTIGTQLLFKYQHITANIETEQIIDPVMLSKFLNMLGVDCQDDLISKIDPSKEGTTSTESGVSNYIKSVETKTTRSRCKKYFLVSKPQTKI